LRCEARSTSLDEILQEYPHAFIGAAVGVDQIRLERDIGLAAEQDACNRHVVIVTGLDE